MDTKNNTITQLKDLLEYVKYLGGLHVKPVFRIDDYEQMKLWEYQLKGKIGIQHDLVHEDGTESWLSIRRLKRVSPPDLPENIKDWVFIGNDPNEPPEIKNKIIKTVSFEYAQQLVNEGKVLEVDVLDSLKDKLRKDVVFRLENLSKTKLEVDQYLKDFWLPWSEEEKPRYETIKIYNLLFTLHQQIELQGEEHPIELIWGTGVTRWLCEGHKIDFPLLEKAVEIDIDEKDGTISIRPRNKPQTLVTNHFTILENSGVNALIRFYKEYNSKISEDIVFSPFNKESYEPILRQAASQLSEQGEYWPDSNKDNQNRKPPNITNTLYVTDSWVIYARPRSFASFVQDIDQFKTHLGDVLDLSMPVKRLVTELSNAKPLTLSKALVSSDENEGTLRKSDNGLYFPKPYNDAQVQIINSLNRNDGVVVQGPPGTGKTHTIANIISHYLATGRRVLVTSKGDSALTVLRDQIPEVLRPLTISLLSNERKGFQQLEGAVRLLANTVSQTNRTDLSKAADLIEQRIIELKKKIYQIDSTIESWGKKQLSPIPSHLLQDNRKLTAMELAEHILVDKDKHAWLKDKIDLTDKFELQFNDDDIKRTRRARYKLKEYIIYVDSKLPRLQDLPDVARIVAIHKDLSNVAKLEEEAKDNNIPPLATSAEDVVNRARHLENSLVEMSKLIEELCSQKWLYNIYKSWLNIDDSDKSLALFDKLYFALNHLVKNRQKFVTNLVEMINPSTELPLVKQALDNLADQKRPFGVFSFSQKTPKAIIEQIRVNGKIPSTAKEWLLVKNYLNFQEEVKDFCLRWNHIGEEFDLPELSFIWGGTHKDYQKLFEIINRTKNISQNKWPWTRQEVLDLFPYGINVDELTFDTEEINKTIDAIRFNLSQIKLSANHALVQEIQSKLPLVDTPIVLRINKVLNSIGEISISADEMMNSWEDITRELDTILALRPEMNIIAETADKIANSGAKQWAKDLKTQSFSGEYDELTPDYWYESWNWKRKEQYLLAIDKRDESKDLITKRSGYDKDLQRSLAELIRLRTNIGLHDSMTEQVQGALMMFVTAVQKIGKGTGKRAPRFRRDANRAMKKCYSGVPCWIMPTWRISESLPSEYGSFDLVIIDEASQSDITALPAILRAEKLLVVGDDKQVSPAAAFFAEEKILQLKQNFLKDQPFAELLLPGVSIYDLANAVFPSSRIMLTEHFRCVEPIIRFSMQFYSEPLIPLRLPKASERLTPPLIDIFVPNGMRDERRKINTSEIDAIVLEISRIVADNKYEGRSIGVISLIGAKQARAIQDRLLSEIGEDKFQKYKIACGDSATFQGKERDIMFLSMVVGPGQGMTMNKREYEQRFNVALSRARDRMYLVRSIKDTDLKNENDLRLKVLRHFTHPMPEQKEVDNLIELCDSEFERDVFRRLNRLGYRVMPQVRVGAFSIDLVVEGDNDRRLAIELDGDKYHPPEKWLDDWQRQRTMERVGWKFWRCWGSSYALEPEACIHDLVTTLEEMRIFPSTQFDMNSNIYTEYREFQLPEETILLEKV